MPIVITPGLCAALVAILATSALMSGLSGFGFSAIGAFCLWLLPPTLGVPLLMSLSTANQLMSIGQLKADMKPPREDMVLRRQAGRGAGERRQRQRA